jgi:Sulfotransferase family
MKQPLFILAPPRSFTSVVCAMIGNHPQMCGLPETNLFAAATLGELRQIHRSRPRFAHGLLRSIAQLGLGGQSIQDVDAAQQWLDEQDDVPTAELFRDLMDCAAPRAVIDKSPMYVYADGALDRIIDAFPEARFLHLSRHPRATCESIRETSQMAQGALGGALAQGEEAMTPEKMWLRPHLRILELLETVPMDQQMFLRGEALMAEPALYLPQIAEWLEISSDAAAVQAMLRPEKSPFASMGPENARLGNDPRFLQNPALRPFKDKPSDLDSPLSWDASLVFDEVVQHYAMYFGY